MLGLQTPTTAGSRRAVEDARSYGSGVVRGAAWFVLSVVFTKGSTFASQLVLGWLLAKTDYGLYAMALSCSTLVVAFKDAGSTKILLHEGSRYAELARPVFWMALVFNCAGGLVLAAAAPFASRLLDAPGLTPVTLVIALALPVSTVGTIQRVKLAVDLRFRAISLLNAASTVARHLSMIGLAVMGFGALSFAIPMIVASLLEGIAGWCLVGRLPAGSKLTWTLFRDFMGRARWLMLSTLAWALALYGGYFAIGAIQTQEVLGVYFFALQLTVSILTPFSSAMNTLLTPSLIRLRSDAGRQADAYLKSVRVLSTVTAPLCVGGALVVGPLIHVLWTGKWDAAIAPAQMLLLSVPLRLLTPLVMSLVEARGRWRLAAAMMGLDATGSVAGAASGALLGGPTSIAAWVSSERVLVSAMQGVLSGRLLQLRVGRLASAALWPLAVFGVAAASTLVVERLVLPHANESLIGVFRGALFGVLALCLVVTIFRRRVREVLRLSRVVRWQ